MSWKEVLKEERVTDPDHKYSDEAFKEVKELLKKLTGEDWEKVLADADLYVKSKSKQIIDEYRPSLVWEYDLYTPHLVRWLKERLQ